MLVIGELIKNRREDKGLSQKKLGMACGVSDSEIHKIESGVRKSPSWNTLCLIAQALDMHPFEYLLVAGYITENDIHPAHVLTGMERLNSAGLKSLQLYIDFLLSQPEMTSIPEEENYNAF